MRKNQFCTADQGTGAKTERFRQRGKYGTAALDSLRELVCIKACKPPLVVTQNKDKDLKSNKV